MDEYKKNGGAWDAYEIDAPRLLAAIQPPALCGHFQYGPAAPGIVVEIARAGA